MMSSTTQNAEGGNGDSPLSRRGWTREEDTDLAAAVARHGPRKWSLIATIVSSRTEKQCRERWFNHLRPEVKKGGWTPEEDALIVASVAELGTVSRWRAPAPRSRHVAT